MTAPARIEQGTAAWFDMVGETMSDAAARAGLPRDLTVSLVERYTDGTELSPGWLQGIRFDIRHGIPSFRVGVTPTERGDINVFVTAAAARTLNLLASDDPRYGEAQGRFRESGDYRVEGDPARLGPWLASTHDSIVARTA